MALTRAQAEAILVRRVGRLMTAASMDGATTNGSNRDFNDPLGWAIVQAGGSVAARNLVTTADLATADDDAVLDLAELRVLESIAGNLALVDVTFGPHKESLGQLGTRLELLIARKRKQVARDHGVGASALEAGVITLGFAQQRETGE